MSKPQEDGSNHPVVEPDLEKDVSQNEVLKALPDPTHDDTKVSDLTQHPRSKTETVAAPIPELSTWRAVVLLIALGLSGMTGAIAATSAMLVIPSLTVELDITLLQAQWVVSSSTLAYGCGMLFAGRFADLYGRRLLFLVGMGFSFVCTIITPAVNSLVPLCVLRALAGLGAAIASPAIFGILGTTFRKDPLRSAAFAFIAMGAPLGTSIGPVLGGLFGVHSQDWRSLFYVLAGFTAIPLVLGWLSVPKDRALTLEEKQAVDRRVDWLGGGLFTVGVCLLLFAVTQGGVDTEGWKAPYVPTLFVVSMIMITGCLYWETKTTRRPIISPAFLRKSARMLIVLALVWLGVPPMVYLVTIQYQSVQGISPLKCAARMLVLSMSGVVCCIVTIYTIPRFRVPWIVVPTTLISGVCGLLYALRSDEISYWKCDFFALLCLSWGSDTVAAATGTVISNLSTDEDQSVNGALYQTIMQICVVLANCLVSIITQLKSDGDPARLREGLQAAFGFTAALCWAGALAALMLMWNWGLAKDVRG